jgi:hypothetical protein
VPNDHETLKVREVAAILRCGKNQAYELIRDAGSDQSALAAPSA